MRQLHIHIVGDWLPSEVTTAWVVSSHILPPEAEELIEGAWRDALREPGRLLFDGPMCRLEGWSVAGGRLDIALSRTSYKQFFGTNMTHPELADQFGTHVLACPVGVSTALETSDGFLLFGRRNANVAYYPGRIHPFAGSLEPEDRPRDGSIPNTGTVLAAGKVSGAIQAAGVENGLDKDSTSGAGRRSQSPADLPAAPAAVPRPAPDPFAAVRRELCEELSLAASDIADLCCTGMAEDLSLRQPELIFRARSVRTRAEIEVGVICEEHHAAVAVPATASGARSLLGDPLLTPVGCAALLLWGRARLGAEWFEQQLQTLT